MPASTKPLLSLSARCCLFCWPLFSFSFMDLTFQSVACCFPFVFRFQPATMGRVVCHGHRSVWRLVWRWQLALRGHNYITWDGSWHCEPRSMRGLHSSSSGCAMRMGRVSQSTLPTLRSISLRPLQVCHGTNQEQNVNATHKRHRR